MWRIAAVALALCVAATTSTAHGTPGDLDASFGSGGVFIGPLFAVLNDKQSTAALDAAGNVLMAADVDTDIDGDADQSSVARLTAGGVLDASFNPSGSPAGTKVLDFTGLVAATDHPYTRTVRPGPGGTIYVMGGWEGGGVNRIFIVRLLSNGDYDTTFSGDGKLVDGIAANVRPFPHDFDLDPSGNILVAGVRTQIVGGGCGAGDATVCNGHLAARYTSAGVLDTTFNGTGYRIVSEGSADFQTYSVHPLPDGGSVYAGQHYTGNTLDSMAMKLTAAGLPDTSFSTDGIAVTDLARGPGFSIATAFAATQDSAGRVVIAGQSTHSGGAVGAEGAVARFEADGDPDPAFGTGGIALLSDVNSVTRVNDLLVGCNDAIVAGGNGFYRPGGGQPDENAGGVARLTPGGVLDTTFAPGAARPGVAIIPVPNYTNGFWLADDAANERVFLSGMRRAPGQPFDVKPFVAAVEEATTCPKGPPILPSAAIAGASVTEGTGLGGQLVFTVTLSAPAPQALDVRVVTVDGTATAPADYASLNEIVSFATGQQQRTVAVPVVGDALHEDNEGLVMSLSGVGSASPPISTATAAGTIIDDDPPGASPPAAAAASPLPASPPPAAPLPPLRAADLLKFPSTKTCASRRRFSIRLRIPKGLAVRRAVVKVNGKQVQVVKGSRLRAPVDLRSFVKGRFTVTITVSAVDGRKVTGTRRYRTCTKKRKGGRIRV